MAFNALENKTDGVSNPSDVGGLFPINEAGNNLPDTDSDGYMDFTDTIHSDYELGIPSSKAQVWNNNDFTSRVWNMSNGFTEPFIFHQSELMNPDQFAIARIDADSFRASQVANGVFNLRLNITEQM